MARKLICITRTSFRTLAQCQAILAEQAAKVPVALDSTNSHGNGSGNGDDKQCKVMMRSEMDLGRGGNKQGKAYMRMSAEMRSP